MLCNGGIGLGHEGTDVPVANVGLDGDKALIVFPGDLARPHHLLDGSQFLQGNALPGGVLDNELPDDIGPVARGLFKAHIDIKAADALEHLSGLAAAHGDAQGALHVADIEAITGNSLPVQRNAQLRRTADLVALNILSALHGAHHLFYSLCFLDQHIQVIAKQLGGQFGLGAGEQFIHSGSNGLGEVELRAGEIREFLAHGRIQAIQRLRALPLVLGLESDKNLRVVHRIGVGADFTPTNARHHLGDLRKRCHQLPLEYANRRLGFFQRNGRRHGGADQQIPFIKAGHKFRAQPRGDSNADEQDHCR